MLVEAIGQYARWWRYRRYARGFFSSHAGLIVTGDVVIGEGCSLNRGVILDALPSGRIEIGAETLIGPYTVVRAANHIFERADCTIQSQGHLSGLIVVGRDVWIGAQCTILPGVKIGEGAVVGAGSVVTRDIPAYTVACGVPARVIGRRGT